MAMDEKRIESDGLFGRRRNAREDAAAGKLHKASNADVRPSTVANLRVVHTTKTYHIDHTSLINLNHL